MTNILLKCLKMDKIPLKPKKDQYTPKMTKIPLKPKK